MLGLIGKKIGMTQVSTDDGNMVAVTVVEVGPCTVVQRKSQETDGYDALQIGWGIVKPKNVTKARRGHLEKRKLPLFKLLKEFRTDKVGTFEVGDELLVTAFKAGERVNVTGRSKGRGFQGVMKRHNKHGGPGSHGSGFHRRPGSIGMRTWPARVPKNMKLPGHMGDARITVKGLEVVGVRPEDNVVLIKGAVPGSRDGVLFITPAGEALEDRAELKRQQSKQVEEKTDVAASGVEEQPTAEAKPAEETKEQEEKAKE